MTFSHAFLSMLTRNRLKVRNINRRYATPRVKLSPAVRWTLLILRIYLLALVVLLGYKFFTIVSQ
ncbi:MAG: hypothetical protein PHW76_06950 [Alphaproteobacteria bacterium]|nr:hypothetical protein [Alphaproteobacteria bacterium]